MYTYELPRRFYNFVESHNNCEDIFLAGMVGEFLRKSGREQPCCIWVDGHGQHLEKIASMYYFYINEVCLSYYTILHNKKHTFVYIENTIDNIHLSYQIFI